ncbi:MULTISPECIES: hypothetical protein [unclassified Burkholderia]|uniref:hypothetical protein n=1 Tax=unclassified Burkholderia TaxID=2613784 RepID=UPI002ABDB745|nr:MULTISPECIES: hypothetical protein [unclassified Burkholderia]
MCANISAQSKQTKSLTSLVSAAFAAAYELAPEAVRSSGTLAFLETEIEGTGGAILRILRELPRYELAFVAAASIPLDRRNDARANALRFITTFALPTQIGRHVGGALAYRLVSRHFSGLGSYAEIADVHGGSPSTIGRHARAISSALWAEERSIWTRLASRLSAVCQLPFDMSFSDAR